MRRSNSVVPGLSSCVLRFIDRGLRQEYYLPEGSREVIGSLMPNVRYRIAEAEDNEDLFAIYASTRRSDVSLFGWPDDANDAFLRMQFGQREAAYRLQFPSLEKKLILVENEVAGSIMLNRNADSISLVDIALLENWRGRGIGSAVVLDIKGEAAGSDLPIMLHVDKTNVKAFRFYASQGFEVKGESQINYLLEWRNTLK